MIPSRIAIVLSLVLVPACYCLTPAATPSRGLLSNRPVVVIDADGGNSYGIAEPLQGGQPLGVVNPTSLDSSRCYSVLEIDQRFGARCSNTEFQTASESATKPAPGEQEEAAHTRWYCNDEWLTRVVLAPCPELGAAGATGSEPRFKIAQIALRSQAKLQ